MLGLRQKLFLYFAGIFLLPLLVASLASVVIDRVSQSFERIFSENLTTINACREMRQAADELNQALLINLWEGARMDSAALSGLSDGFERQLRFQQGNITVTGERDLTDSLTDSWARFKTRYFALASAQRPLPERRSAYQRDVLPALKEIQRHTKAISELNSRNILSADGQVRAQARKARRDMALLLSSGGLLLLGLLFLLGRNILKPIRSLTRSVQEIEKGNLDLSLEVRSRDELGQLAEAFNSMAARLREFRRSDQAKLIRTQRTTQLAINSLPDAVAVLTADGTVEISNEPAQALFGIKPGTRADGLGLPWLSDLFARVTRELRPVNPVGYESAIQVFRDGAERFFLPHLIPIRGSAEQVYGVTVVLADITELRRLDETKSDLISTVSHEFKTRLTSVRMAVHLLLDEKVGDLNSRQSELLLAAREDSEHLNRIIEGLLDIGRIRAGRLKMETGPMPAEELVRHAVDGVRHAFQDKGLSLEADLPPDLPQVQADPSRVNLILENLLSNALKYTSAGGKVKVSCGAEDGFVVFKVRDTGAGIPAADLPKVFERFYRGSREREGGGAGLGLAIAREVVEAHGGNLTVESQEGRGSTFTFTLPRADAKPEPGATETPRSAP